MMEDGEDQPGSASKKAKLAPNSKGTKVSGVKRKAEVVGDVDSGSPEKKMKWNSDNSIVHVCLSERERVCVCVCVCVRERERNVHVHVHVLWWSV